MNRHGRMAQMNVSPSPNESRDLEAIPFRVREYYGILTNSKNKDRKFDM